MFEQILRYTGHATLAQIFFRSAMNDAPRSHQQRSHAGVGQLADAHADIQSLLEQVDDPIHEYGRDFRVRMTFQVLDDARHHERSSEQHGRGHSQAAARFGIDPCGSFIGLISLGENAPRIVEVALTHLGGTNMARGAMEKLDAEPLLERRNRPRHCRRGHSQPPGAGGEAFLLGDGPLELVVSAIRQLTPRIRGFELRDPAGGTLPAFDAGSHLQVPVRLVDGESAIRHCSICSDPARRDAYEIAVLREDAGTGGSRAVHNTFDIGLRLRCELPRSYFHLHVDARPAVLIAGGIGITPIISMALALKARRTDMQLHYAAQSGQEMAFRDQLLRELPHELTLYRSTDAERMNIDDILTAAPRDAVFYICGPARLIDAVVRTATSLSIASDRIRFERFMAAVPSGARSIRLELRRSGKQLIVPADQSILDAMLEAGVDAPFGCKAGNCKSCAVKVLAGEPDPRDSALAVAERTHDHLMCPCISRAKTDHLTLDM